MVSDWFVYALASAACVSGFWIATRAMLRGQKQYRTAALFLQVSSIAYWLPLLAFENVVLPQNPAGWLVLLAASLVWTVHELLVFNAQRSVEASIREPLFKTRLLWAAAIGFLVLGEAITPARLLGAGLVLAGALVVSLKNGRPDFSQPGAMLVLAAAVVSAVVTALDDVALKFFSVTAYAVLVTVPVALLLWFIPAKAEEKTPMAGFVFQNWRILAVASALGAAGYWLKVKSLSLGDVTDVVPVVELSTLFATLGGILLLGERGNLFQKLAGMALALLGALAIHGVIG